MATRKQQASEPVFSIRSEPGIMVPMRDGVKLAADIFRPEADGKFPALVSLGPSSKELISDLQQNYPPQPPGALLWNGGIEGGSTEYIVPRGYAHVIAQIRGLGDSEGMYNAEMHWVGRENDSYDLIEWVAQQTWCDGNVGMIGISAWAANQLSAAIQRPPHLKAIFPYDTPGDLYRDGFFHGGVLSLFYVNLARSYAVNSHENMEERKRKAREIRKRVLAGEKDPIGYHITQDVMMYPHLYGILLHPQLNPWMFDQMLDPFDGPVYRRMSFSTNYDKIGIPVYCGTGWYAYTYTHLAGAFRNYSDITKTKQKKLIIGPAAHGPGTKWYHLERPFYQYHDEIIRWYDYWLKGLDTGIMDELPIKIFVMGVNKWRYESEWPLARTQWTKFYLRTFSRLLKDPPRTGEEAPDVFVHEPLNITNEIARLRYVTPALTEDIEVTGPIALHLYASIQTRDSSWVDTNWIASLIDVDAAGVDRELTRGWLKASHKSLDEARSKLGDPQYLNTQESITTIEPNRTYEFVIGLRPTSNVFKAGHRIKLEILSADTPGLIEFMPSHLCRNDVVIHSVYRSKQQMSHLLVPVIPETDKSRWLDTERASLLPSM